MHGLILTELKRFADWQHGKAAWQGLLREAGLDDRLYVSSGTYPDAEVVALVAVLAKRAGTDPQTVLAQFGEFIVPTLMSTYKPYIKPEWKTLEMIEHTEANIHRAVRVHDPGAAPPELKVRRVSDHEVVVLYESKRRMCAIAKGIIRGVAAHYREHVEINELTCMLKGKPACTIAVTLTPAIAASTPAHHVSAP